MVKVVNSDFLTEEIERLNFGNRINIGNRVHRHTGVLLRALEGFTFAPR